MNVPALYSFPFAFKTEFRKIEMLRSPVFSWVTITSGLICSMTVRYKGFRVVVSVVRLPCEGKLSRFQVAIRTVESVQLVYAEARSIKTRNNKIKNPQRTRQMYRSIIISGSLVVFVISQLINKT